MVAVRPKRPQTVLHQNNKREHCEEDVSQEREGHFGGRRPLLLPEARTIHDDSVRLSHETINREKRRQYVCNDTSVRGCNQS